MEERLGGLEEKSGRLEEKLGRLKSDLERLKSNLVSQARHALFKCQSVNNLLSLWSNLSQSENVLKFVDTVEANNEADKFKKIFALAKTQERDESLGFCSAPDDKERLIQNMKEFDANSYFGKDTLNSAAIPNNIKLLAVVYNEVIRSATFLESPDASSINATEENEHGETTASGSLKPHTWEIYKKIITKTEEEMSNFYDCALNSLADRKDPNCAISEIRDIVTGLKVPKVYIPGPRAQEVHGHQPIFLWVLRMMARSDVKERNRNQLYHRSVAVDNGDESLKSGEQTGDKVNNSITSTRSEVGTETTCVPGDTTNSGTVRYVDFTVAKQWGHLWVYRDDCLPFVIEIKPFVRPGENWQKVAINALQKVLASPINYVGVACNFAARGIDGHAASAIGTLAYINVYRLKLTNMGTSSIELTLENTGYLPLMFKDVFDKFEASNKREGENPSDTDNISFASEHELPLGFVCVYQLMSAPFKEMHSEMFLSDQSMVPVGYETTSIVFACEGADGKGHVLKVSRFGRRSPLTNEKECLQSCGQTEANNDRCKFLPTFIDQRELPVKIRGYNSTLPAMKLSPRCKEGVLEYILKQQDRAEAA